MHGVTPRVTLATRLKMAALHKMSTDDLKMIDYGLDILVSSQTDTITNDRSLITLMPNEYANNDISLSTKWLLL